MARPDYGDTGRRLVKDRAARSHGIGCSLPARMSMPKGQESQDWEPGY